MRLRAIIIVSVLGLACGPAAAAPHPHHDDGGFINWKLNWRSAVEAAQRSGKPIFIEAGREA